MCRRVLHATNHFGTVPTYILLSEAHIVTVHTEIPVPYSPKLTVNVVILTLSTEFRMTNAKSASHLIVIFPGEEKIQNKTLAFVCERCVNMEHNCISLNHEKYMPVFLPCPKKSLNSLLRVIIYIEAAKKICL